MTRESLPDPSIAKPWEKNWSRDDRPRCADCGQPLLSWGQRHTVEDCEDYQDLPDDDRWSMERQLGRAR